MHGFRDHSLRAFLRALSLSSDNGEALPLADPPLRPRLGELLRRHPRIRRWQSVNTSPSDNCATVAQARAMRDADLLDQSVLVEAHGSRIRVPTRFADQPATSSRAQTESECLDSCVATGTT